MPTVVVVVGFYVHVRTYYVHLQSTPLPLTRVIEIGYRSLVEIYIDLSIFRAYEARSYLCYRMNTIAEHKEEIS